MGAGDEVPDALRQLGVEVTLPGEDDLRRGDLSRFDAIVAGVRAYNVRADLRAYQQRLLDYVNNGGTYVVQYMSAGSLKNVGPYPITIAGGNGYRVDGGRSAGGVPPPRQPVASEAQQDRAARLRRLGAGARAAIPHGVGSALRNRAESCGDPGEKPLEGGELWTRYGKGVYVFTA